MRNKTATFRFGPRDHEILNNLAKARGQNKTQVLKRMLWEEEAREEILRASQHPQLYHRFCCPSCKYTYKTKSPASVVCPYCTYPTYMDILPTEGSAE